MATTSSPSFGVLNVYTLSLLLGVPFALLYLQSRQAHSRQYISVPLTFHAFDAAECGGTSNIMAEVTLPPVGKQYCLYDITLQICLHYSTVGGKKATGGGYMRVGLFLESGCEKHTVITNKTLECAKNDYSVPLSSIELCDDMKPFSGLVTLALSGRLSQPFHLEEVSASLLLERRK